jgi:hypothetical protein
MDVAGGSVEATTAAAIEVTPIPAARNFDLGLHNLDGRILRPAASAACGSSRIAPSPRAFAGGEVRAPLERSCEIATGHVPGYLDHPSSEQIRCLAADIAADPHAADAYLGRRRTS